MNYPNRNQILGMSLVIVLIIALGGFISYNNIVNNTQKSLEEAEFVITKLEITKATNSLIEANGRVEIRNFDQEIPKGMKIDDFVIYLSNKSESITSVEIPLKEELFSNSIEFDLAIPVDVSNTSKLSVDILTNIMIGKDFTLDFRGDLDFTYRGISDKITFENKVFFDLQQEFLGLNLNEFDIYQNPALINFSLYNPFSLDLFLRGSIDIVIDGTPVGTVRLNETKFNSGQTTIENPVDLKIENQELFGKYFTQIAKPVILETNLEMKLDELVIETSPQLPLNTGGLTADFIINAINYININSTTGGLVGEINGTLTVEVPIQLNISKFSGDIYTDTTSIGTFNWDQNRSILIGLDIIRQLNFLQISSSLTQLANFDIDQELSFRNIHISVFLNNQEYNYFIEN